ncbi:pimeloyl-ACP methyl ester carboxylesterase [Paenibacillus sp. DS2015]|uniref:hypothetical protein n=1 Tax=Paenibacillus sp. DS2015 TaxID=3373917 RepID=UPI003D22222E
MLRGIRDLFFFQYVSKPFSEWFFHLGLVASGNATAKVAVSFRDESLFTDLDQIHVPTLILHGIHDKICVPQLALVQKQAIKTPSSCGSNTVVMDCSTSNVINSTKN